MNKKQKLEHYQKKILHISRVWMDAVLYRYPATQPTGIHRWYLAGFEFYNKRIRSINYG